MQTVGALREGQGCSWAPRYAEVLQCWDCRDEGSGEVGAEDSRDLRAQPPECGAGWDRRVSVGTLSVGCQRVGHLATQATGKSRGALMSL